MKLIKLCIKLLLGVLVLAVVGVAYQAATESTSFTSLFSLLVNRGNLHEVYPSELYRSAELDHSHLREVVAGKHIGTVVDLRWGKEEPSNGETEESTLQEMGIEYVHFPLLGSRVPEYARIKELIELFDRQRLQDGALLVHCSSGTHRSGVASAIWLMTQKDAPLSEAKRQLSLTYGFVRPEREFKSWIGGEPTVDNILWYYEKDLQAGKAGDFRSWVDEKVKNEVTQP